MAFVHMDAKNAKDAREKIKKRVGEKYTISKIIPIGVTPGGMKVYSARLKLKE